MTAVTQDLGKGVIDRFRAMPMSSSAVLVGRSAADMLQSALGLAVLAGVGLLLGRRWHGSAAAVLTAFALLLLLRFAMLWIGISLGLVAGRPELVQAVQILVWPVGSLSNAFATLRARGPARRRPAAAAHRVLPAGRGPLPGPRHVGPRGGLAPHAA